MKKTIGPLMIAFLFLFLAAPLSAAATRTVTTVVVAVDSNADGDGYKIKTQNGTFDMAYGAGGYGKFGEIYDLVLESMEKAIPVVLTIGADGIEDVARAK